MIERPSSAPGKTPTTGETLIGKTPMEERTLRGKNHTAMTTQRDNGRETHGLHQAGKNPAIGETTTTATIAITPETILSDLTVQTPTWMPGMMTTEIPGKKSMIYQLIYRCTTTPEDVDDRLGNCARRGRMRLPCSWSKVLLKEEFYPTNTDVNRTFSGSFWPLTLIERLVHLPLNSCPAHFAPARGV